MIKYILRRILYVIPTLIGVSFIIFGLLYLTPGDAAEAKLGSRAPKAAVEAYREELGLNDPFLVQYGRFLGNAVQGDLGESYINGRSVTSSLMDLFPATIKLTLFSLSVAVIFGIIFGILSAIYKYTWIDRISMVLGMVGLSMPIFWSGILFILLFAVKLQWFPSSGFGSFKHLILPGFALGFQSMAVIMRQTRGSMLEVMDKDYIRTARAKGLKEWWIIIVHALKNAMIPVITSAGLLTGSLLGGSVLTETIFSIPGIGRLMVSSISTRDYPIILGGVLLIATTYSLINLLVDILYGFVDPKVRSQYK
ncbi:ABC transporter permease [Peptoniphilus sp. KCTC 25270]|uniref:ABC transporter permease n=1 Tax=Peptoniphilus sp. KCTC 25270 TaxID=2897414 RepID=UPI001E2876BF|nr:ABC transporter permease [Peptoniphilus sp. KCTC 25270]MCD1147393.1 ABC transporter permease [Peptoniphilus sp. KCTC 25270]